MNADVEKTLEAWAAAWSSHDVEHLLSLFTDDCVYEDLALGAVNHGKAEVKAWVDGMLEVMPDLKLEQTARFVAGDWAGMEWMMSGTLKGDLPGMPATNKHFSIRAATIVELASGKIKRCSDYYDPAAFLK